MNLNLLILVAVMEQVHIATSSMEVPIKQNLSEMAVAMSEILQGLKTTKTITILNVSNRKSNKFNELVMEIHRLELQTCIFNHTEKFFQFIDANLKGSSEVTTVIFQNPEELIHKVRTLQTSV